MRSATAGARSRWSAGRKDIAAVPEALHSECLVRRRGNACRRGAALHRLVDGLAERPGGAARCAISSHSSLQPLLFEIEETVNQSLDAGFRRVIELGEAHRDVIGGDVGLLRAHDLAGDVDGMAFDLE